MVYAHPGTIPGWSEYLWIPRYSDKAIVCGVYSSQDGQSISGSWASLARVEMWCVWSSHYCPGMVRVSLELKNSMPFYGVTGHPSRLRWWRHRTTSFSTCSSNTRNLSGRRRQWGRKGRCGARTVYLSGRGVQNTLTSDAIFCRT